MTEKMREEFEAAFAKKTASLGTGDSETELDLEQHGGFEVVLLEAMADDRKGDNYGNNVFASAWWAWRASREALVIELPKAWQTNVGAMLTPNGVRFAIEAAGLKVKP